MVTSGDNLYPLVPEEPTQWEFSKMMGLFEEREALKDVPVFPVRGNHDCYFNSMDVEVELAQSNPSWRFENWYYEKQFEVGPNGEKFSLLNLDSCFMLCETINSKPDLKQDLLMQLDDHSREIIDSKCDFAAEYVQRGNEQMAWIKKTVAANRNDEKIVWRASNMHHPLFGLHYNDYQSLINDFLPVALQNDFDVYFNGHEHLMNYGFYDKTSLNPPREDIPSQTPDCNNSTEIFMNGSDSKTRSVKTRQGERLNQFTTGASGKENYQLCSSQMEKTQGVFQYAENKYNGFALVYVTHEKFQFTFKGVVNENPSSDAFFQRFLRDKMGITKLVPDSLRKSFAGESAPKEILDLFEVEILRNATASDVTPASYLTSPSHFLVFLQQ
mmetsp:Transcript_11171/g.18773  ORF Transcript_11171/g.18773 Transcript_11171/m.18773 type:complete len:385 (-) Transcript_11171:28-1182(-)